MGTGSLGQKSCMAGARGGQGGRWNQVSEGLREERRPEPAGEPHIWVHFQEQWETIEEPEPEGNTFRFVFQKGHPRGILETRLEEAQVGNRGGQWGF